MPDSIPRPPGRKSSSHTPSVLLNIFLSVLTGYPSQFDFHGKHALPPVGQVTITLSELKRISFLELIREETIICKVLIVFLHGKSCFLSFMLQDHLAHSFPLLHLRQLCIHKRSFCQLWIYNFGDWRLTVVLDITGHGNWPVAGYLLWLSCLSRSLHCVRAPHTHNELDAPESEGVSAPQ